MFVSSGQKGVFHNDSGFIVNFNYLINSHNLVGNFVIEHWNAPQRQWAYYESLTDKYYVINLERLEQPIYKVGIRFNIFYNNSIKPTDAILFTDTIIVVESGKLKLTPTII